MTTKFRKQNLTAILITLFILLILANIIYQFYQSDPGGQSFNNWVSPLVTSIGLLFIIIQLRIMKKANDGNKSQDFLHYYNEFIDRLQQEGKSSQGLKDIIELSVPGAFVSPMHFYGVFLVLNGNLRNNIDFKDDIAEIKKGNIQPYNFYTQRSYWDEINALAVLTEELEYYYTRVLDVLIQIKDHNIIIVEHKEILVRNLIRELLYRYYHFCRLHAPGKSGENINLEIFNAAATLQHKSPILYKCFLL